MKKPYQKSFDPVPIVDPARASHLDLAEAEIMTSEGIARVLVNQSESPLAWLARRKGRDGRTMIDTEQFVAGEKLRADFTRGNLSPRVTSSWSGIGRKRGAAYHAGDITEMAMASRQRVTQALNACGPEFSGLLLDVCCFLRGLEDVERERGWPARSGKVVLQLGLDKLARHYGLRRDTHDTQRARIRTWSTEDGC